MMSIRMLLWADKRQVNRVGITRIDWRAYMDNLSRVSAVLWRRKNAYLRLDRRRRQGLGCFERESRELTCQVDAGREEGSWKRQSGWRRRQITRL